MEREVIHGRLIAGVGLALALLVFVAGLTLWTAHLFLEDNRRVTHSYKVLAALEGVRAQVIEAETGQRGFLITGDRAFLESSRRAALAVGDRLADLQALTANRADGPRRLAALVGERLDVMERTIQLRQAQGLDAAREAVRRGPGPALTDRIHTSIDALRDEEHRRLRRRTGAARASARDALACCSALIALALGLLGTDFFLLRRDIAQRARAEEVLRRSQERYELAVQGSSDGLWDWDLATDEVFFSARWKGQLGYEDHEIPGHFEEWESRLHPEDHGRALAAVREYLAGSAPVYELEHRLRHKDGGYRWILARGVALRDRSGRPYRMAGSHTDITARKESERQLAEKNRLLEEAVRSERAAHDALKWTQAQMVQAEKLASLGQMVAGVAHEINNPLSFTINNVAVLQRDLAAVYALLKLYEEADDLIARERPCLRDRIRDHRERADIEYVLGNNARLLERTRGGLGRIQRIVKDLRSFARLDEGDVQDADLNEGIKSTAAIARGHARNKGVELDLDLGPIPPVTCRAAKVNQVVMNLLSNAIDASPRGGRVTVRTRPDDSAVVIEVSDQGAGIDPAIRGRIFDPFFTTKPVGQGTGLGLSISDSIVREHSGWIEVDSAPDRGTQFTVRLPTRPALAPAR